jgi:LacI family transcriptional regulator
LARAGFVDVAVTREERFQAPCREGLRSQILAKRTPTSGPQGQSEGARAVTVHDVARHAGVASMTVSRVVNGNSYVSSAMRERVEAAIKELNYTPNIAARNTRAGAAGPRIGVLYSNPSASYLSEVMLGGIEQSSKMGTQLVLERSTGLASQKAAVRRLLDQGVDGVILPPPLCDSRPTINMLHAAGVKVLALATARPMHDVSSVRIDDYQGAAALTRHLIELGHRRIAFIKGDPQHTPTELRYDGFVDAMMAASIPVDPELVVQGKFTYRSGLAAAELLLAQKRRPTAIFASNDDMAAAALAVAHGLQIAVPTDLTVVGFDDTPIASTVWPELTTVHQPISAMGRAAVSLIVDEVKAERAGASPPPTHQLMKFTLIKRGSSGPAPTGPRKVTRGV